MARQVWEYQLFLNARQLITIPVGSRVLSVKVRDNTVCMFVMGVPEAWPEQRSFAMFEDHQDIPSGAEYIGSVDFGPTWHVFEVFE